jgi:hypothetical protein
LLVTFLIAALVTLAGVVAGRLWKKVPDTGHKPAAY